MYPEKRLEEPEMQEGTHLGMLEDRERPEIGFGSSQLQLLIKNWDKNVMKNCFFI